MAVTPKELNEVEELVRTHQTGVRGFLVFLGCPARLVDDLVQEVFLSALAARFEARNRAETAAYLRKVARHLLGKALERESRAPAPLDFEVAEPVWTRFEGEDGGRHYLDALRECVSRLVGQAADVIRMRYRDGLQRAQIGEQLQLSEAGVKSILVRTRARLRACVERRLA
jgi:RNA polymerase sigma-70 factor (ECF subfamily)